MGLNNSFEIEIRKQFKIDFFSFTWGSQFSGRISGFNSITYSRYELGANQVNQIDPVTFQILIEHLQPV